jgi:hypothetical protein
MTPAEKARYDTVMGQINDHLFHMQTTYDSRYLATALIARGAYLLRLLQAGGVMTEDDVSAIVQASFADVHEPTAKPTMLTIDGDRGVVRPS